MLLQRVTCLLSNVELLESCNIVFILKPSILNLKCTIFFKFLAVIYVRSYILTFNKMKLFHLFVLKMTTHFHVGGALWESDYSAQARTVQLTDRLFLRRPEKN